MSKLHFVFCRWLEKSYFYIAKKGLSKCFLVAERSG